MRIRQVKPAFWGDKKVAALPERTRLFYIGTWMLADDAGWLRWDASEAGRELYGFDGTKARESRVQTMLQELVTAGRIVLHDCGHAFIPTLREHQRFASLEKQYRAIEREHKACPQDPAVSRDDPRFTGTELELVRERELVSKGGVRGGLKSRLGTFEEVIHGGKSA